MKYRLLTMLMIVLTSFSCGKDEDDNVLVDIDGNRYKIIGIGTQTWMAENLKVTRDRSGNPLESYCYIDRDDFCKQFGRLYTWEEALKAAPAGWHVPSDEEWQQLELELGISPDGVYRQGWRGTDHGLQLAQGGSSGFEGLYAGYKDGTVFWDGRYFDMGYFGAFWTRTYVDSLRAVGFFLYNNEGRVLRDFYDKTAAFSVRCLKD